MEVLSTVLPIVIEVLLIVLITVFIIVGIKIIGIMNRTERLINNVEEKVNSFNTLFGFIDKINGSIEMIAEKAYSAFDSLISKFTRKKKQEDLDLDDEDEI